MDSNSTPSSTPSPSLSNIKPTFENIGQIIKQSFKLKLEYFKIKLDQIDNLYTKPYDISFILVNSK